MESGDKPERKVGLRKNIKEFTTEEMKGREAEGRMCVTSANKGETNISGADRI